MLRGADAKAWDVHCNVDGGGPHGQAGAVRLGLARALKEANPVLMEPVMEMVVSVPSEAAGTVFSDLTSQRRAHVVDQWNEAIEELRADLASARAG